MPPPPSPKVNWSQVNTRALANDPKPKLYPKLGCNDDPTFYQPYTAVKEFSFGPSEVNFKAKHEQDNPFGAEWGLETDAGVISVSGLLVHGHTWSVEKGT